MNTVTKARPAIYIARIFVALASFALLGAWITHLFSDATVLALLGIALFLDAIWHGRNVRRERSRRQFRAERCEEDRCERLRQCSVEQVCPQSRYEAAPNLTPLFDPSAALLPALPPKQQPANDCRDARRSSSADAQSRGLRFRDQPCRNNLP